MLHNFSRWHTERAPTSSRKVNSIEEVDFLTAKFDAIYAYISKQNIDNVPLLDLVENHAENIDVNYIFLETMGMVTTTTILMLSPHMFLTSTQVVTMFLMI
jgi:hypothetical protein